jgi:hypothetical protein
MERAVLFRTRERVRRSGTRGADRFKYGFLCQSGGNVGTWANTSDIDEGRNNGAQSAIYRRRVYAVLLCNGTYPEDFCFLIVSTRIYRLGFLKENLYLIRTE